jgi:hypothetical protein
MSERVLTRLGRLNPTLVFLAVAVVVFAGLLLPGVVGAAVLLALAAGAGWLLSRTWPVVPAPGRAARLAILLMVVVVAIYKAS